MYVLHMSVSFVGMIVESTTAKRFENRTKQRLAVRDGMKLVLKEQVSPDRDIFWAGTWVNHPIGVPVFIGTVHQDPC